ncbi:hypothetical protein F443_14740 [Phytophthora nicotianae P1569]|uniref:Uncharacterized protein n=1 Tax=Phytophthora nicotianae P1569 TaxID=1317065 RepID=V9EKE0_PHYNI|nr:hypothetical protein F443_14740 [Phytophthora nicotianae P1569]
MAREERAREDVRIAREEVQQSMAREEQAREDVRIEREQATYFATKGLELATKVVDMHGKWDRSHVKSIENPVAGSKRPVVALLNASGSEEVRNTHNLPPGQYPLVFKIVEGQEDEHVKKELTRLCNRERGCVELVPPQYYANGITLRDSIRKRIDGWILEQVNAGNDVGIQFADGITGDVGEYVRNFFIETVKSLLETPSDDF